MQEPQDLDTPELRLRAIRAAQGQSPFDLLIAGAQVADVVTGRLRPADIGIVGPLIASVQAPEAHAGAHEVIDASGLIVLPGLIDMHMHVESSMVTPSSYVETVLPRGVTSAVWDPHELANVAGLRGMDYALEAAAIAPMRFLTLAPSCVPSAPGFETTGADFTPTIVSDLLARSDVHGVAEVMSMKSLLSGETRISKIVNAGLAAQKRVCGHARGLEGSELDAYVASGIRTDHELTSGDDLIAKLQAGLTIELRGSHDDLLPEFVKVLNALPQFPQTVTLCTDDVFADDLLEQGGLDSVVRRLICYGLDPLKAVQAATLNAATQLGRRDLGLVAPGRRADLAIVDTLTNLEARLVIINGQVVASNGALTVTNPSVSPSATLLNSVDCATFSARDFAVPATGPKARVVTIKRPRFTEWGEREVVVRNGLVTCPADLIQMVVINRFGAGTPPRLAFLEDWGAWRGVFATTVSHDSHNVTMFGTGQENMALAANRIKEIGGGLVVVAQGRVLAELPLEIGGLISADPLPKVAGGFREIRRAMDKIVDWQPPLLVFKACFGASLVCNAGPRLSDAGIVDSFAGIILETPLRDPQPS